VRKHLNKALELEPTRARAWYALAALDAEAGNLEIAAGLYRKAIKFKPDYAAAHRALGRVLEQSGRRAEALAAYAGAMHAARRGPRTPASPPPLPIALAAMEHRLTNAAAVERHHAMAANADIFSPTHVPPDAVANLFDKYAEKFDAHLRGALEYRVPELIVEAVAEHAPWAGDRAPFGDALDLGCGTGLCGPLLRPLASNLAGVDLSPQMVEKARERGVYDHLHVGELVATLREVPPSSFDLLVAADVLIYLGDLGPTYEAAAAALRPGGLFAFSLEASPAPTTGAAASQDDRYHLNRKTLRFTHARAYLDRLARIYGFATLSFDEIVPRVEAERPVPGYLIVLRAPPRS
jgi:predicted TPR repeat methyltransferase